MISWLFYTTLCLFVAELYDYGKVNKPSGYQSLGLILTITLLAVLYAAHRRNQP